MMTIKADANKQTSFEIFFQRQINDPDIFITMDPAETKDWIDIIISSEYIKHATGHPFDEIYANLKIGIPSRSLKVRLPLLIDKRKYEGLLFYLNIFDSNYGTVQISLVINNDQCCKALRGLAGKTGYIWKNQVNLSEKYSGYFISLPDFKLSETAVSLQEEDNNVTIKSTLKCYWIHNAYKFMLTKAPSYLCSGKYHCINYSSVINYIEKKVVGEHYYVYLLNSAVNPFASSFTKPQSNLSWNEACKMCLSVNGTLPILRSKDQQDEILSLLSSSFTPPTIMIMYIGLFASHNPHEVRNINYFCEAVIITS